MLHVLYTIFSQEDKRKENVLKKILRQGKNLQYSTVFIEQSLPVSRPARFKPMLFKGQLYLLPFSRLPFHSVDGFFCYGKAF